MTVIRPNSISGVTSITALANEINVFKHDGVLAGLQLNGVNHHTSSGVSTFHTLNVLGNVSVGGTLTYQDVTNVDSLGIGTFRTGINVSGGQLDVGSNIKLGNAGVITATSFSGDGSNLTGISVDSTKIETGNTKVETVDTGSDGHVKITTEGSERLRINSSGQLLVGATGNSTGGISEFSKSVGGGGAGCHITVENTSNNSVNNTAGIHLKTATGTAKFFKYQANQTFLQSASGGASELNLQASGAHPMRLYTNGNERLRIDSSGRVLIGTTTEGSANADELTISYNNTGVSGGDQGRCGLTIRSGDNTSGVTQNGYIYFSDGTSGGNEYRGVVAYSHSDDSMYFSTAETTRLRITSTGELLVGTTSASNRFKNGNGNGATPKFQFETANDDSANDISLTYGRNNSYGAEIILAKHRAATVGGHTIVQDGDRLGGINFAGSDGTHFRPAALIQGRVDGTPGTSDMPGRLEFRTTSDGASTPTERMRIRSDGHVQLQHGLTGLSGGGVIVCAAKSSSGTANQSNYKVDFVVPMADLGTKQEYEDIQAQFAASGQTGSDYAHNRGGSGILIATVQNDYYWGFRTKIYHITTYGNNSNNVTQLNLLHNYSAAGHGGNSASVDLTVQSHDGKTPTLRGTFSGDYWNSNILTVTYIGSAVASTGNIRQLTAFDSKLTGQDPTWK